MNMIFSNSHEIRIAAVQCERIRAGLINLVFLKSNVMVRAHKTHADIAALKMQTSDDQVGRVFNFDVIFRIRVTRVAGPRKDRRSPGAAIMTIGWIAVPFRPVTSRRQLCE